MTILDVKLKVSPEVLEYLKSQANERNIPLDDVISLVLADYIDEPTKEDVLETMRQSLREGLAGKARPVEEVLAELKTEFDFDADES